MRKTLLTAFLALAIAPAAQAHKADPHYLTVVNSIQPATPGIDVTVINRSDQLQLQNTSGKDVVINGYDGEPYARVLADKTVQVNTDSPAYYLNQDRYGATKPPAGVTAKSPPQWKELDKTGRFQWHDHRMHWMSTTRPASVKNPDLRQKIFDWTVPIHVSGQPAKIAGTLFWTPPPGGGAPTGAIIAGIVIVLLVVAFVIIVRRRRPGLEDDEPAATGARSEAW